MMRLIIFSSYRSNAEKLYAQLKILHLNDIYKLQIAKLRHSIQAWLFTICSELFIHEVGQYTFI